MAVMSATRPRVNDGIDGKDAVGLYLEGIARTALLTAQEEVELARTIEAGLYAQKILDREITRKQRTAAARENGKAARRASRDELQQLVADGEAAMQRFVTANLRLVVSVARRYGRAQMPLLDLVQEGNTGLIRAVEKFDYAKGFKFSTYATWWVRQSISRGMAQQGRIVRLPVHVAEQVNQVSAVRRNLERTLGREPELEEIADELGLTLERVVDLIRYGRDHISLDAPVEEDGDTSLGDLIAREPTPGPDEMVIDMEERERLEDMLADLDERSADVVRRRYGLVDGRQAKLADIGQIWGITAERVRQIERHALAKLRTNTELAA
ncbi:MAG TPA: sigma-70 family RNA polymerase sigma factor [Propionibacterium sp.]|jgi:RNA polymerase sigma factor (sigma-70 family)|nr:sigma-70 family RNA polymerase sigma factor [Propionibacterium sp.]